MKRRPHQRNVVAGQIIKYIIMWILLTDNWFIIIALLAVRVGMKIAEKRCEKVHYRITTIISLCIMRWAHVNNHIITALQFSHHILYFTLYITSQKICLESISWLENLFLNGWNIFEILKSRNRIHFTVSLIQMFDDRHRPMYSTVDPFGSNVDPDFVKSVEPLLLENKVSLMEKYMNDFILRISYINN